MVEAAIRIERSLELAPQISQGSQRPKIDGSTWTQVDPVKKKRRKITMGSWKDRSEAAIQSEFSKTTDWNFFDPKTTMQ